MPPEKSLLTLYPELSWDQEKDLSEDRLHWLRGFEESESFLSRSRKDVGRYLDYCGKRGLEPDNNAISLIQTLQQVYEQRLDQMGQAVAGAVGHGVSRKEIESSLRGLHQLRLPIARAASWVCEAYEQSTYAQAFNTVSGASEIKYDRYESKRVSEIEQGIKDVVKLGGDADLLVTSSGVAAYQMADYYLRDKILQPDDTVLIAHPLYSEVTEAALKGFDGRIIKDDLYEASAIVDRILETNARAVYVDPMKNRLSMRLCDVDAVIEGLKEKAPERAVTLIVDGTMTTGSDKFFETAAGSNVEVLYYSSCCKYMQLGQDCVSAGFIAYPEHLKDTMKDIRRACGSILYDNDAWIYPDVAPEHYEWRMDRMQRNALLAGQIINDEPRLNKFVEAVYPGLPAHEDFALSAHYRHLGSLLTFRFKEKEPSHHELNGFVSDFIRAAGRDRIEIVNGESFGFGIPRLYVGWTPTNLFPPFLRLSAGDRTLDETRQYAELLRDRLVAFDGELSAKARLEHAVAPAQPAEFRIA